MLGKLQTVPHESPGFRSQTDGCRPYVGTVCVLCVHATLYDAKPLALGSQELEIDGKLCVMLPLIPVIPQTGKFAPM